MKVTFSMVSNKMEPRKRTPRVLSLVSKKEILPNLSGAVRVTGMNGTLKQHFIPIDLNGIRFS